MKIEQVEMPKFGVAQVFSRLIVLMHQQGCSALQILWSACERIKKFISPTQEGKGAVENFEELVVGANYLQSLQ